MTPFARPSQRNQTGITPACAAKWREFLGGEFRGAVADPDGWIRRHLDAGVDEGTLRLPRESRAAHEQRMFRILVLGRGP